MKEVAAARSLRRQVQNWPQATSAILNGSENSQACPDAGSWRNRLLVSLACGVLLYIRMEGRS